MKSIVFDMDGVLFDTERVYFEAWDKTAEDMGIPLERIEEIRDQCAGHNNADITVMFNAYFGGEYRYEDFGPQKTAWFHRILDERGIPIKKGLFEILDFLKEDGYRIALATSTRRESAVDHLTKTGILHYFDVLTTGDMFEHGKPDPEIYLTACRLLECDPAETYAVEDSYPGLESAHRAGMKAIMIPDMFPPTEFTRAFATEYPSLLDLRDALKNI